MLGRKREPASDQEWQELLGRVALCRRLPLEDRAELQEILTLLLRRKRFEGAGGLVMTDAIRVAIASQAAVLLLHRRTSLYSKLGSIIVYPGEYTVHENVETEDGWVDEIEEERSGEAWTIGAVVLSWGDVIRDLHGAASNVVLHEFAHQLDAESGAMNGAPVLASRELRRRWADTLGRAFERLQAAIDREEETLLDPYGAEDAAEFFAVSVEAFFLQPEAMQRAEVELYRILRDYFRQDPSRW